MTERTQTDVIHEAALEAIRRRRRRARVAGRLLFPTLLLVVWLALARQLVNDLGATAAARRRRSPPPFATAHLRTDL